MIQIKTTIVPATSPIKVIAFDLDGVLYPLPQAAYLFARAIGLKGEYKAVFVKAKAENLSFRETIIEMAKIWKGVPVDGSLTDIVMSLPMMPGAEEVIHQLREWGYHVGCISSGSSQFFMEALAEKLGLDFVFTNVLGHQDDKMDGTVEYVMGPEQKAETVSMYLRENGYTLDEFASVGNGENDIYMLRASRFSIAFNPMTERVSEAATTTVESEDLRDILEYFERM